MACTSSNTIKPDVVQRPSNIYGAPLGQGGRTFDSVNYGVQGIILHCTDMTISQYIQYLACLTQPVAGVNQETNHHYSIGSSGALNQHIDDDNISWTFGNYTGAIYPSPPTPTKSIQWETLQGLNGVNVSSDVYVINILIAKSYNQSTNCLTSSGLPKDQHEKLIQLLAYLVATYEIPLDADHINWHDNIASQACPSNECTCNDIACLLTDINTFCEEDCNTVTYSEVSCTDISHLLATPSNCGNAGGCIVSVPFDACCLGNLPQAGEIEQFVGCAVKAETGDICLVKNVIQVTAPITGNGTSASPLALDRCAFGVWAPTFDETDPECPATAVKTLLGIGDDGCLYQSEITELIAGIETPITIIDTSTVDLTSSGANGHTLQADVKISTADGNLLISDTTGLFVGLTCDGLTGLFEPSTGIVNFFGIDENGNCVFQEFEAAVDIAICNTPIDDGNGEPMHILGRDINLTCPTFYTPTQVVFAGLAVEDTLTVNLTMEQNPAVSPLNVISANVNVDPAIDNILQVTPDGLYVAPIQAQAGDTCLNVQVDNGVITISHIIDPKTNNVLVCGPDGLCVIDIVPVDTDCFDMSYDATTREISGAIIFAPDQENISNVVECISGEGLYVPRGANLLVNEPLVGDGSEINPLDINFALMDNQDLCDFGGVIPETFSLVDIIGLDANGCLRQYTGEQFIEQFLNIINGDCITATLNNNELTIEPVISPAFGGINNILSCTSTGLYVPQGAGITPQTTNCIDIQLVNGALTATPILNPDILNQLSCTVDGLYIERGAGVIGGTTNCIQVVVTDGEIEAAPIVSGAILGVNNVISCEPGGFFVPLGAGINPVDSDCLTIVFDTSNGDLTIEPIISPLIDNTLQCTENGLYVPSGFIQAVDDTNCITLDVTGSILTATPIIDTDTENLLECRATGLFASLDVLDTTCIDVTISNGVLSIQPIIDSADQNLLTCGVDGLLAELNADIFEDSDCINFDVADGLVTATPILAPDQGAITNILRCIPGQGLYVPVGGGITTLNGSCVELELIAGVLTAEIIIDEVTPDNAVTCGPNGLYVPICCPIVEDTTTVNLTLSTPRTISADVIIDPDPDNALVANPNGLFVPEDFIEAVAATTCLNPTVVNGVLQVDPVLDPLADNILTCGVNGLYVPPVTVVDTNCINAEIANNVLTINPIISATAGNAFQCLADGMYVPQGANLATLNTDCLSLTVANGVISGNPIISATANNQISCEDDGLFVTPAPIVSVTNTDCIDLAIRDGGILDAEISISNNNGNQIQCFGDGLFVPLGAGAIGLDTDCFSVDITNGEISVTPIIDPALDNQISCLATGLSVPPPFITAVADHQCLDLNVTNGLLTITPIIDPADNNALTCGPEGLYAPTLTVVDGNCINIDITNNVVTAEVIVSAQANNIVQCLGDGLFAQAPIRTVDDTDCISLVLNGGELTASPVIDPNAANAVQCLPTGLFVPEAFITAVVDTQCIELDVTDGILTVNPIIDPNADNQLSCTQNGLLVPPGAGLIGVPTDCLTTIVADGEISVNPILAPDQGPVTNVLICIPGQGLFSPAGAGLTVIDGNCIDLTITNGNVIQAEIIVDPAATNILACGQNGLLVELFVNDTNCIELDLTGGIITANPIIAPGPISGCENSLVCDASGLFVPQLQVLDTNCIDLTFDGCTLSADPIISAEDCNGLLCLDDGLFVNNDVQALTVDTTTASTVLNVAIGDLGPARTVIGGTADVTLTNPSVCNRMAWTRIVPSSVANFHNHCAVAPATVNITMEWSNDGGATFNSVELGFATIPPGEILSIPTAGFASSFIQAVGATNTLIVRTTVSNPDGNFCGTISGGDIQIKATGITVIT